MIKAALLKFEMYLEDNRSPLLAGALMTTAAWVIIALLGKIISKLL